MAASRTNRACAQTAGRPDVAALATRSLMPKRLEAARFVRPYPPIEELRDTMEVVQDGFRRHPLGERGLRCGVPLVVGDDGLNEVSSNVCPHASWFLRNSTQAPARSSAPASCRARSSTRARATVIGRFALNNARASA